MSPSSLAPRYAGASKAGRGVGWVATPAAVLLGFLVSVGRSDVALAVAVGAFVLFSFRFRLGRVLGLCSFLILIPPTAASSRVGPQYWLLAGEFTLAVAIMVDTRDRRIDGWIVWGAVGLVATVTLAAFRGVSLPDPNSSPIVGAVTMGTQILLVAAGACRLSEDTELDELAGVLSVTGLVLAVWAGLEFALDKGFAYPLVSATRRAIGPFGNPNYFGALLALIAVLCVAAATIRRHDGRNAALLALAGTACAVGVLATLSRGALVGLAAGIATLLFMRAPKHRRRHLALLLTVALLGIGFLTRNQFTRERIAVASSQEVVPSAASAAEEESLRARFVAGEVALTYALQHPWDGIGLDRFAYVASRDPRLGIYMNTHNEPLRIAAEAGIPALVLLVLFVWMATVRVWRRDPKVASLAIPVMVSYGVMGLFLNGLENSSLSFPVVMAVFLAAGYRPAISTFESDRHNIASALSDEYRR